MAPFLLLAFLAFFLHRCDGLATMCSMDQCAQGNCQSICDGKQASDCTSWCYNLGNAPNCTDHCFNFGAAPLCTSYCFQLIGGFNNSASCNMACEDPSTQDPTKTYYPRQHSTATTNYAVNVNQGLFYFEGPDEGDYVFTLNDQQITTINTLRGNDDNLASLIDALDGRVDDAENLMDQYKSDAESFATTLVDELREDLASSIDTLSDTVDSLIGGSSSGFSLSSAKSRLDDVDVALGDLSNRVTDNADDVNLNYQAISALQVDILSLGGKLDNRTLHANLSSDVLGAVLAMQASVGLLQAADMNTTQQLNNLTLNVYTKTQADNRYALKTDPLSCSSQNKNLMRFNDNSTLQYCNGSAWIDIAGGAAVGGSGGAIPLFLPTGCGDILRTNATSLDGYYNVKVGTSAAVHYCLMSLGGYTAGGDGSSLAKAGYSCGTIRYRFPSASALDGLYWVNPKINDIDGGSAAQVWCVMTQLTPYIGSGDGLTSANPAISCETLRALHPVAYKSGAYWIKPVGAASAENVYCDMTTQRGGWTLLAKVLGKDPVLNARNTAQWRDGVKLGDTSNLNTANAVGALYSSMPFTDVMIRSLSDANKNLGWRHPKVLNSARSVVTACTAIDDGVLLFGSVSNLDHPSSPLPLRYNGCSELRYGFLLADYTYTASTIAGCSTALPFGHAGGIVGAAIPAGNFIYGRDDGTFRSCISNFNLGSGYYDMLTADDQYSINAHWWGNGNEDTNQWNAHGFFVRQPIMGTEGGDGSSYAAASISCDAIKTRFKVTVNGLKYLISSSGDVFRGYCDFSSTPAFNYGGDGSTYDQAGVSCASIKQYFPSAALISGPYWVSHPSMGASQVYCEMVVEGGGWTLVAKVHGNDPTLNAKAASNLRGGVAIGNPSSLADENALAFTYSTVPFNDVMLMSLSSSFRRVGWRFPTTYSSVRSIVQACSSVRSGTLLFGNIDNLDYPSSTLNERYRACKKLEFGFLTNDYTYTAATVAGCANCVFGHVSGVFSAAVPSGNYNYGVDDGYYRHCVTSFAMGGGGFYDLSTVDDQYAINAHWWGSGNDDTNSWNSHAAFVRVSGSYLLKGNGSQTNPGVDCDTLKTSFSLPSGFYWLLSNEAAASTDAINVYCDMSTSPASNLGNDGTSAQKPGASCLLLMTRYNQTTSGAYYIIGLRGLGELIYCDMTTNGGGWTLVAKVLGNDVYMNARNMFQWRQGRVLGSQRDLSIENGLTAAYSTVAFTDVMVRSNSNPGKALGWRHPTKYANVRYIVQNCLKIGDGVKLFGTVNGLDHPAGVYPERYQDCSALRFGFLLNDYVYQESRVAGCYETTFGHASGVFGAAVPSGDYAYGAPNDGVYRRCLSSWGIGSGYYAMGELNDQYSINAHWWGNGNEDVYSWGPQAVFVR